MFAATMAAAVGPAMTAAAAVRAWATDPFSASAD
jgi:hypothetical protein